MSSLIPEKPLLVSPSLAATIGLEEATLLSALNDMAGLREVEEDNGWLRIGELTIQRLLPFWTAHDVQRISKNLCDKGIIELNSAPFMQSRQLTFAFNGMATASTPIVSQVHNTSSQAHNTLVRGANRISPQWQPSDEVMAQIAQYHIPRDFTFQQLPEFITYFREKDDPAHSWGAKFIQWVKRAWRDHETQFQRKQSAEPMGTQWRPSEDAMDVLVKHAAINQQFVEDAIPEFVLYWQERGESSRTWNSKFIQHVRKQWSYYTAAIENDSVPKPIPKSWTPGEDVYDVLRLANIDIHFAEQQVQEFVLFWYDSKQAYPSWNTKFLQHVKYQWAKQFNQLSDTSSSTPDKQSTRERSLEQDLTDRSWAY
jgi:hypothetical protein